MKTILKITISFILTVLFSQCIAVNVANNKVSEIKAKSISNPNIKATGTKFIDMKQRKWSNNSGESFFSASFSEFYGTAYMELKVLKPISIKLNHNVLLASGSVAMLLEDESGKTVVSKKINGTSKETQTYELDKAGIYLLKMKGDNADGSYFCQWEEL